MHPIVRVPVVATLRALVRMPERVADAVRGAPVSGDSEMLDPHVQLLLRVGERLRLIGQEGHSAARRRRSSRLAAALAMPRVPGVGAAELTVPGAAGPLPARLYRDGISDRPLIMYLHGGGWVTGDLDTHDDLCRAIAQASGCAVIAVDYRKAPEHPFPAAFDDVVAAFRWLRDHPLPRTEPGRVAVMGDSAGGGLAAALSQSLRHDRGPIAQGLLYPSTDLRMLTDSIDRFATGFFLTRATMHWFREQYAPDPAHWSDERLSPGLAAHLAGLPPTWIWTAGFDPLCDEAHDYADRLRAAGVIVQARRYPDQIHGFASMGILPGAMQRLAGIGREYGALVRATGSGPAAAPPADHHIRERTSASSRS